MKIIKIANKMTQEDKELLLKDLCARVPYGVKCHAIIDIAEYFVPDWRNDAIATILAIMPSTEAVKCYFKKGINQNETNLPIENIKPYLRPMNTMTEEEYKEYRYSYLPLPNKNEYEEIWKKQDWLNSHHFDYRGLIEKGLALEAPEDMYKN